MVAGVDTIFGRLISVSGKTGSYQKTPYVRLSSQIQRTTPTKLSEAGVLWHVLVIEGKEWQKVGWDYNWENGTTAPI